jgi:hypothetical protein
MGINEARGNDTTPARIDMKLEVVVIPLSDVGRAKGFHSV